MSDSEIDLLAFKCGSIVAPAGCGKTHLIAQALSRHAGPKPVLVLTHTNAGVAALRGRLDKAGIPADRYRLYTLDGWALRLLGAFPRRSGIEPQRLLVTNAKADYPAIRKAAAILMRDQHANDILVASYSRLIIDEYQDCEMLQHCMVYFTSAALPTVVLGDPMQAIFTWAGTMPDWEGEVCKRFQPAGELTQPWRWINAGTKGFGDWLLDVRQRLKQGLPVDLKTAPGEVTFVKLDGTEDRRLQIRAGMTNSPTPGGSVLIIGDGKNPQSQREFASRLPGAITVESVELNDLLDFAKQLVFERSDALKKIVIFASRVMTNVGAEELMHRIAVLERGSNRREASDVERAALQFQADRTPKAVVNLLVEISKDVAVRTHRPAVIRACYKALQSCDKTDGNSFYDCAIRAREQNRLNGRALPKRAVGSTLLLKGLEADVAVILDGSGLDVKNLYVGMTRGSRRLVMCAKESILNPHNLYANH